jgi:polysaccharide chain length determinant protein (PEP-CTERM system associated)
MNPSQTFDISQILNSLYRRKDIVIAVALVVTILAAYLAVSLPNVYRSSTLILVTPQRLPSNYVASTVTSSIEQRMQAIAQQVLGRTMLEKVVQEFDLFHPTGSRRMTLEQRVAMLRQRITLAINRQDTFTLSFDAESPENARRVAARIASLFIDQNLKVREQQAAGTTTFISSEAERLRKELEEQEARVNKYRAQYWLELPENRDANFKALDQLQRELENGMNRLASLQDRKAALEKQMAESDILERELSMLGTLGVGSTASASAGPSRRNSELAALLKKYSAKHPDVIRLKREVEAAEATATPVKETKVAAPDLSLTTGMSLKTMLSSQVDDLKAEMAALQTKNKNLQTQVSTLQSRLDGTPLRSIELSKISRDYDITLRKYQDLLAKALESELSENMEKKQKGEQFQIVDPASLPQDPVAPNRERILLVGLLLGIGGGVGFSVFLDFMDKSFKSNDDLVGYSSIPLLAVLPAVATRGSVLEQRQARALVILGSLGALAAGLVLVRYAGALLLFR